MVNGSSRGPLDGSWAHLLGQEKIAKKIYSCEIKEKCKNKTKAEMELRKDNYKTKKR